MLTHVSANGPVIEECDWAVCQSRNGCTHQSDPAHEKDSQAQRENSADDIQCRHILDPSQCEQCVVSCHVHREGSVRDRENTQDRTSCRCKCQSHPGTQKGATKHSQRNCHHSRHNYVRKQGKSKRLARTCYVSPGQTGSNIRKDE